MRVPVRPELLSWALERSSIRTDTARYRRYAQWAAGEAQPTFRQLEEFANATHAPLGYLFLEEPPTERVPIPDFRTIGNKELTNPSADLLDTIYAAQNRQNWYRDHAVEHGLEPVSFVGSVDASTPPNLVAESIRIALDFTPDRRARFRNWEDALRQLIDAVEQLGVLVMVSGIVGNSTRRKLDPEEFRGFALSDPMASLIFINGADTKSAQIFTLIHELAHVWVGESALSDAAMARRDADVHELWANAVAAEVLVPAATLRTDYRGTPDSTEIQRLSRRYKVSTLVILKRLHDTSFLTWDTFSALYGEELARIMRIVAARKSDGGDFYNTQPLRLSQTFARAVIVDALEGRTLFRDAYSLLGTAKHTTFEGLAEKLGVS